MLAHVRRNACMIAKDDFEKLGSIYLHVFDSFQLNPNVADFGFSLLVEKLEMKF